MQLKRQCNGTAVGRRRIEGRTTTKDRGSARSAATEPAIGDSVITMKHANVVRK